MTGAPPLAPFPREILAGPTLSAARAVLGARLVRAGADGLRIGRIVEVEAYIGEDDAASHARFGRTARNAVMFGDPGRAYVYLVYGMHHCLNIVAEPAGRPAAVLIRAVEPEAGIPAMRGVRAAHARGRPPATTRDARLAAGPGLVTAAFSIDRSDTGVDLCDPASPLRLAIAPGEEATPAEMTPRIGIAYAREPWRSLPWRLLVPASPALSGPVRMRTGSPA